MSQEELTQVFAGIERMITRQFAVLEQRLASMDMRLRSLEASFDLYITEAQAHNVMAATTPVPRHYSTDKGDDDESL